MTAPEPSITPPFTPAFLDTLEGEIKRGDQDSLFTIHRLLLLDLCAAARRGVEADAEKKHLAFLDEAYASAMGQGMSAQRRAEKAEADCYVPGVWRCAKCQLRTVTTILNTGDGNMHADSRPQDCANGCGPMWRISERDERKEAQALFNAEYDKRVAAEAELAKAMHREAVLKREVGCLKSDYEMVVRAWQREICSSGIVFKSKNHWIDFMVLATRQVMALAVENGVKCCGWPELCTNEKCNVLLRQRLDAIRARPTEPAASPAAPIGEQ